MASRLQLGGWECACCPLVWGLGSGGGRRPAQGIQPKTLRVPPGLRDPETLLLRPPRFLVRSEAANSATDEA